MHPTAALLLWLAAVISAQFAGYAGLALLIAFVLLARPSAWREWARYVYRGRWLLVTLWLILAYNTPGETPADLGWAPTFEGMAEASLHAARLAVMLLCLSWLFGTLGRDGLLSALWGLLQPLQTLGLDCRRLVVRLSLVLDNLQSPPEKGAWKKMLTVDPAFIGGPDVMLLALHAWRGRDIIGLLAGWAVLIGIVLI